MYNPAPLDISHIQLSPELESLGEMLAEIAHDRWARARIAQGWTLGDRRDDDLKLHPCLIPYAQLPESEKDLDRVTAIGTLKTLLALGYRVQVE